jgi:phosphoglycolate phosphatase
MRTLACFDLDGCLVLSDAAIEDALRHALEHVGLASPDAATVRAAIGPPLVATLTAQLVQAGHDPARDDAARARLTAAVNAYRARYEAVGFELTVVAPGVPELLDALRSAADPDDLVVVTAKPTAVAAPLLEHVGLQGSFTAIHGVPLSTETSEEKRVTLARALAQHEVSAEAAVMIGDRSHDVRAGLAVGTATVGVLWGAGARDELREAGAHRIVERPAELLALLGRGVDGRPAIRSSISSGRSAGR